MNRDDAASRKTGIYRYMERRMVPIADGASEANIVSDSNCVAIRSRDSRQFASAKQALAGLLGRAVNRPSHHVKIAHRVLLTDYYKILFS